MNSNQSQRIVFGLMVSVTALAILGDVTSGKSKVVDIVPRRMVGGTIAGILLMLLAVPAPKLAIAFGGLASAASLISGKGGEAVIKTLYEITGTSPRIVGGGPRTRSEPDVPFTPDGTPIGPIGL